MTTTATTYDAWVLSRIMAGLPVEGELESMTAGLQGLAEEMREREPVERQWMMQGYLMGVPGLDQLPQAILHARPNGPPPDPEAARPRGATLADVRRLIADQAWPWPGWLAASAMTALASDPGVGKTLLAMNLARCLWLGLPWPDGHRSPFPPGTKTLWVPGDHHYGQLLEVARAYGLPDEAMLLNATADEPIGVQDLDDTAAVANLSHRIESEGPGLVIVDTVSGVTNRSLGRPEEARELFGPLQTIAARTGTPFLMLTHLSREGEALGRRIVGFSRVVWKLSHPDKDGQPDRRRLWVDKSYALKPPPLGMTITPEGCTFDFTPPSEPEAEPSRRPAVKVEACKAWLKERLRSRPDRVQDLRRDAEREGYASTVLYKASVGIGVEEYKFDRRTWWKLPLES